MRVNGETEGLKIAILQTLNTLYDVQIPKDCLWTKELIEEISSISSEINREIAVYIDRKGRITDVSIGNNNTVSLSVVEGKRNSQRLSGTRCIHTHPSGNGMLSSHDVSSLKILRLNAIISVGIHDGSPQEMYVGIISSENQEKVDIIGPYSPAKEDFKTLLEHIVETDKNLREKFSENKKLEERAILIGINTQPSHNVSEANEAEFSLLELEELTKTAGAIVVGRLMQKRASRTSKTLIGKGKLAELILMAQDLEADVLIFDEELTGAQLRNIEEATGLKVLSRTSLILDIFAQRARSREGILQVELAQMEYRLPRLIGMGQALSRLGSGIGSRGPGETKLETDRRTIRAHINHLREQLEDIYQQRNVLRSERKKNGIPVVSLAGYTNTGKSTLLNTLCNAEVLAEDKLFATLDTTTRKLMLNDGSKVLLSDTVGFIRKLPHNLIKAFKATLEEVVLSDLILIVADASDPQMENHIRIVSEILAEIGAGDNPSLIVLNKIDKTTTEIPLGLLHQNRQIVEVSATLGYGLSELKDAIKNSLYKDRVRVRLAIPFSDGATIAWVYANGHVLDVSYDETTTLFDVELYKAQLNRVGNFLCTPYPSYGK